MNIFEMQYENNIKKKGPLAERMRPMNLSDFVGQKHIVGEGRILNRAIKADKLSSAIFYGPPGTGKTTLARIIAENTNNNFTTLNAVTSGIKDIKGKISFAVDELSIYNRRTILFIDEIHRFNKAQQDALLPYVENGTIILVGATTENPYFEVNQALISRSLVFEFQKITNEDIKMVVRNALKDEERGYGKKNIELEDDALNHIVENSNGDIRKALSALELGVETTSEVNGRIIIDINVAVECIQRKKIEYDKNGDSHYDTISAFIKSMRGSDPDAAVFWLAKMIKAGEDPKFIARRIIICASEDVGNADPRALEVAVNAFKAVEIIGFPEGRITLAQAAIYVACAPKSNASIIAISRAMDAVEKNSLEVPLHLRDSHYGGAEKLNRGVSYKYPHDYDKFYVKQSYLPETLKNTSFYEPKESGYESKMKKFLEYLKQS
ncbi:MULTISPECIES: replication-associated recombination protein A [unclassified Sedimentibacter]|uniref:replication-associated recombination protein A n=1 Tax=unclassified Sedimentibacter TaxID=2649220 RepID=UPI0027E1C314|nr:replication-associated recombination protein A [Sedimentibacter sp. MB35-C1]WMJ75832.1 replication-associated recombination protein A [Sedimentibacter sp. MB35-C1]